METQESRYEIHYQLANTNKMPIIEARCENVILVSDRKALNHQKSDLHQQQDRACLKMQALKETLDNTLLLSLFHLLYTLLLDLKQSTVVPVTEKHDYIYIYNISILEDTRYNVAIHQLFFDI